MSTLKTEKIFVGVDVSKFHLDVFDPDTGVLLKLDNTESAVAIPLTRIDRLLLG